jgi:hypothetical protein
VNAWLWVYAIPALKTNDDRPFGRAPGQSSTTIVIDADNAEFEAQVETGDFECGIFVAEMAFDEAVAPLGRLDAPILRPY